MNKEVDKNFEFFRKHLGEYLNHYPSKFILIKDEQFVDFYDTFNLAYESAIQKNFQLGSFLIQQAVPEENNIQIFHSRVAI